MLNQIIKLKMRHKITKWRKNRVVAKFLLEKHLFQIRRKISQYFRLFCSFDESKCSLVEHSHSDNSNTDDRLN